MLDWKRPHSTILDEAVERTFQSTVPIGFFGMTIDPSACGEDLGSGAMNVAAIVDFAMPMARTVVTSRW